MTTNETTKTTATVGNSGTVHIAWKFDRGITTNCGAEGRRYNIGVREVTGREVTCHRCDPNAKAPKVTRTASVAQTADDIRRILEGRIARLTESLSQYRTWLAAHPGDAGLIESIEHAEAGIAKAEAELAAM